MLCELTNFIKKVTLWKYTLLHGEARDSAFDGIELTFRQLAFFCSRSTYLVIFLDNG
jgi:hypothetical protein